MFERTKLQTIQYIIQNYMQFQVYSAKENVS